MLSLSIFKHIPEHIVDNSSGRRFQDQRKDSILSPLMWCILKLNWNFVPLKFKSSLVQFRRVQVLTPGVSFVFHEEPLSIIPVLMLMSWLRVGSLDSLRMWLVTRKAKRLKGWHFQPHPHLNSREGCGAGDWALLKLWNKEIGGGVLLGWWTYQSTGRAACPVNALKLCTLTYTLSYASLPAVPQSYLFYWTSK